VVFSSLLPLRGWIAYFAWIETPRDLERLAVDIVGAVLDLNDLVQMRVLDCVGVAE
jgi:hypothetical protein